MMRKEPSQTRVTISVSCEPGREESHKLATTSAGGVLSEKNRWRFDWGDKRSMNSCISDRSPAVAARIPAVVPSRRMSHPDSASSDRKGGMYSGWTRVVSPGIVTLTLGKEPVRLQLQHECQCYHDRAARKFQPTPGAFLQLSASQGDDGKGHHKTVVEDVRQIIQAEIAVVLASRYGVQRQDLGVERRKTGRSE
jgi:hypothetical protein